MATRTQDIAAPETGNGAPDPRALMLAGALQADLPDAQILLFGSRATGGWRPRSDIDLAVIGVEAHTAADIKIQARPHARVVYGEAAPSVQIFTFTTAEFMRCRTALPHIAGQVQRYGLTPTGDHLPPMAQDNPWPEIQELLQSSVKNLAKAMTTLVTPGSYDAPVFFTQGALENAIKARLLALRIEFKREHDMVDLVDLLPRDQRWLVDIFTSSELAQMSTARNTGMYTGDVSGWQDLIDNAHDVLLAVQDACVRLESEVLKRMGKTVRAVGYDADLWIDDRALAGWGSVSVDHMRKVNRLRVNCDGLVPAPALDRIARTWLRDGPPADAMARVGEVMANPDTWPTLLDDRETDDAPPPKGQW